MSTFTFKHIHTNTHTHTQKKCDLECNINTCITLINPFYSYVTEQSRMNLPTAFRVLVFWLVIKS